MVDSVLTFMSRHFWLVALVVTATGGLFKAIYVSLTKGLRPDVRSCRRKVALGWAVFGSVPWAVMGLGIVRGHTESVLHYLRPRTGGGFVLAFWLSIAVLLALGTCWVFLGNGAHVLSRARGPYTKPGYTRLTWGMCVAAALLAFVVLLVIEPMLPWP